MPGGGGTAAYMPREDGGSLYSGLNPAASSAPPLRGGGGYNGPWAIGPSRLVQDGVVEDDADDEGSSGHCRDLHDCHCHDIFSVFAKATPSKEDEDELELGIASVLLAHDLGGQMATEE